VVSTLKMKGFRWLQPLATGYSPAEQPRAAARFKVHRPALTRPSADIVATAAD